MDERLEFLAHALCRHDEAQGYLELCERGGEFLRLHVGFGLGEFLRAVAAELYAGGESVVVLHAVFGFFGRGEGLEGLCLGFFVCCGGGCGGCGSRTTFLGSC